MRFLGQRLFAAKDQAGDVVRLASLPDEGLDAGHNQLERFLGGDRRKIANQIHQATIGEFLARGIEGFNDAIREQDEQIARA